MARNRILPNLLRAAVAVALVASVAFSNSSAHAADFIFIRNSSNKTATITRREIRQLFTGQTKQWGGSVVQVVIGEPDSSEFRYLSGIFGLDPRELLSKIKQEVFRGEMRRPIVAKTAPECISAVGKHEGGIGVVPVEAANALPAEVARLPLSD
jgi:ABC-type phosphate transport system substrate-binding protein